MSGICIPQASWVPVPVTHVNTFAGGETIGRHQTRAGVRSRACACCVFMFGMYVL